MKRFLKKFIITLSALAAVLLLLFLLRVPLLRAIGYRLAYEDRMAKVDAAFVLSGDPFDRGNEAVRLYKAGLAEKIVCTGENVPRLFLLVGIEYPESELTQLNIIQQGIPSKDVLLLCEGTSTKEESDAILDYCIQNGIKTAAVISTKFHTKRIQRTFQKKFSDAGVKLIIRGAPSSAYDEDCWWCSENGLIFVNNEYLKIFYYLLKGY